MASTFPGGEELIISESDSESESDVVILDPLDPRQLHVGSTMQEREEISVLVKTLMKTQKKNFRLDKKYSGCLQVKWVCTCDTCTAHIQARRKRKNNGTYTKWKITSLDTSHCCDSVINYTPALLASLPIFLNSVENNTNITADVLQEELLQRHIAPDIDQIYKAKQCALKIIENNYKDDFYRLIPYLKYLHAANPNSVYNIELDESGRLQRCFFGVAIHNIITCSLPICSADGTYSRNKMTKGVWLSFNILTSNNKLV